MTVGGWFDAEDLFGALETYRATERLNPGITNVLVMGPWAHGEWGRGAGDTLGPISFHARTAEFFREKIELPFFRHFLKGTPITLRRKPRSSKPAPTNGAASTPGRPGMSPRAPCISARAGAEFRGADRDADAFDEYVSDPAKPVPFTSEPSTGYPRSYPVEDQRFAASRPDVLVYETGPLGRRPHLRRAAQGHPARLHDGHRCRLGGQAHRCLSRAIIPTPTQIRPALRMGGYQQLVRGDVFRGRFRNGLEKPEPFQPGQVTPIEFTIPDIFHTFRSGHRVMVQVQSSWFPLVDRNPQTFVDIATAKPEDFRKATQRVYRTRTSPSRPSG